MSEKIDLTPEELEAIQGMPPQVAVGYLNASRNSEWGKLRTEFDRIGDTKKTGNPVHDARIDEFNDLVMDELKRRQKDKR